MNEQPGHRQTAEMPETPETPDEPAAAHDATPEPAQAGRIDTATWGAVALGIVIGLLVALAFLAAGTR